MRRQKLKRKNERQPVVTILALLKGRGLDRVGDDLCQWLGVGDLLELGVNFDLDGDSPVLVHAVLLDSPVLLPLPHLLDQPSPGLGDLEVDEEVVVLVKVGPGIEVLEQFLNSTVEIDVFPKQYSNNQCVPCILQWQLMCSLNNTVTINVFHE